MECYQEQESFEGLNLCGERIEGMEFVDCTFQRCVLEEMTLRNCRFTDCTFMDCRIANPTIEHTLMTGSRFVRCGLMGVAWKNFSSGYLLPVERFTDCQLRYHHFLDMELGKFDFSGSTVRDSMFADCRLRESCFSGCSLQGTEFFRCDLSGADFRHASGYTVDLEGCTLRGARFSFPEVVDLLNGLDIVIE